MTWVMFLFAEMRIKPVKKVGINIRPVADVCPPLQRTYVCIDVPVFRIFWVRFLSCVRTKLSPQISQSCLLQVYIRLRVVFSTKTNTDPKLLVACARVRQEFFGKLWLHRAERKQKKGRKGSQPLEGQKGRTGTCAST